MSNVDPLPGILGWFFHVLRPFSSSCQATGNLLGPAGQMVSQTTEDTCTNPMSIWGVTIHGLYVLSCVDLQGRGASTHIYDAVLSNIGADGKPLGIQTWTWFLADSPNILSFLAILFLGISSFLLTFWQFFPLDLTPRLYFNSVWSRSPPQSIHWRTTKRLQGPNLVGLVKLKDKGRSARIILRKWRCFGIGIGTVWYCSDPNFQDEV